MTLDHLTFSLSTFDDDTQHSLAMFSEKTLETKTSQSFPTWKAPSEN